MVWKDPRGFLDRYLFPTCDFTRSREGCGDANQIFWTCRIKLVSRLACRKAGYNPCRHSAVPSEAFAGHPTKVSIEVSGARLADRKDKTGAHGILEQYRSTITVLPENARSA